MKEFELVYDPQDEYQLSLFTNADIQGLAEPITIQRDNPVTEDEEMFFRKKSEVVEHEDEEYTHLKEQEQEPLVMTDNESRSYAGKLQNIDGNTGVYFAMVNTGTHLKLIPIQKWYHFVQRNQFSEGDVEKLDKQINLQELEEDEPESDNGIDFEETFDDDDENEHEVVIEKKKVLSRSGEKILGLMESYDGEEKAPKVSEEAEDEEVKRQKMGDGKLTKGEIKQMIGSERLSARELLKRISTKYPLGDYEKNLIKEFVHESCILIEDSKSKEKVFKLKEL